MFGMESVTSFDLWVPTHFCVKSSWTRDEMNGALWILGWNGREIKFSPPQNNIDLQTGNTAVIRAAVAQSELWLAWPEFESR
jgi:hypothetical protein